MHKATKENKTEIKEDGGGQRERKKHIKILS